MKVLNKIHRLANKADYSKAKAYKIIDRSLISHVSFVDDGNPISIPMAHWRIGDYVYFHSANKGRFSKVTIGKGVCVSMAEVTGLVLARSAFEHTYNYTSVILHGVLEDVQDEDEKRESLRQFVERLYPGRWEELRPINDAELCATKVLRLPIEVFACKERECGSGPDDGLDEPDLAVWTGVIPIRKRVGSPVRDETNAHEVEEPSYLEHIRNSFEV